MYVYLSEAYAVHIENNCSYLLQINHVINKNKSIFDSICIPVFMGYILAHVGDHEFEYSLKILSDKLNVSVAAIRFFVDQLIDNTESRRFTIDEAHAIILPPEVLCKSNHHKPVKIWETADFDTSSNFIIKRPQMPFSVNLMATTQCTTDCVYCYADRSISPIMKTAKILDLIEELHSGGVINITLTGGDVLTRHDWVIILRKLREYDYFPYISTKTPISRDQISILRDLGYDEIQFSLDSCSESTLRSLVKAPAGYFHRVIEFLKNSEELGMKVLIRSVLTSLNSDIKSVEQFYKFLTDHEAVNEWAITPAFFSTFKSEMYKKLEVSNDDLKKIYDFSKRDGLKFPIKLNKINQNGYRLKNTSNVEDFVACNQICLANTTSMSILANGNCSICEMLYEDESFLLGNVNDNSVNEIWNSDKALDLYYLKQQNIESHSPCSKCEVYSECRQGYGKKICYLDIRKTGNSLSYPDPRCPMANDYNLIF